MRLCSVLGVTLVVALAAGCTSGTPDTAPSAVPASTPPPFAEPRSYTYVLTRGCDQAAPLGRYRVTVRDGAVVTAERLDLTAGTSPAPSAADLGPIAGQEGEEIEVPTLGELLAIAQTAEEDGGQVTTTYDARDGHPVQVTIDVESPECFTVAEYAP